MARNVLTSCVLGVFATIGPPSVISAQVVDLRNGVHVQAPFVSVDVFPGGGVSVRAPYAAIDVGPRYEAPPPLIVERQLNVGPHHEAQDLSALRDDALLQSLRATSFHLSSQLNRFDTAATWHRYFRLPEALAPGVVAEEPARRAAITKLLDRFQAVAIDPHYRKISRLSAFASMQAILTEMDARFAEPAALGQPHAEELPPPQQPGPKGSTRPLIPPQ